MIPSFEHANCLGKPHLFESTHPADHRQAKALCDTCPEFTKCLAALEREMVLTAGTRHAGGGPVGTWAGQLIAKRPTPEIKYSDDERRLAHNRYVRGERDEDTKDAEREYQRLHKRTKRAA